MPAVPFKKTGTVADENATWTWNADTQNAILGDAGDDWAAYKAAHAWWDGSTGDDAKKKAPYKLPHHQKGENGLETVFHGVTAAMARLEQSDIPDGELKATFDHLAKHYAQWDKTPPEWDRFLKRVHMRRAPHMALPFGTTRAQIVASRPDGRPTDDDLMLINKQARSPLTSDRVYVIPMRISDNTLDAYYTRMTPLSLNNFARDAAQGVAFCDSHNHYQMPIGRSFAGDVITQGDAMQTNALAYMLRGMNLPGGMRSDDYITGMEGGIYQDDSIGFDPQHYWCSVCNLDMLNDYDCSHWPGRTYESKDGEVLCTADVDAGLVEFSLVYKGANENASTLPNGTDESGRAWSNILLLKADVEVLRGRATARDLAFVEDRCRVRLFQRYPGYAPTPKEDDEMKGSEFVRGLLESFQRSGKEISKANMDRLQGIHDDLKTGHDTMADAMRAMADFMSEKDGDVTADPDGDGDVDTGPVGSTDDPDGDGQNGRMPQAVTVRADGTHDAMTGEHTHGHSAYGAQGDDATHEHAHSHSGDANHQHAHDHAAPAPVARGTKPAVPAAARPVAERLTPEERAALIFAERVKTDTIEDALRNGARAMGERFNTERYRAILTRLDYDEIRAFAADWDATARAALSPRGTPQRDGTWSTEPTGKGGRQTTPQDPNDPAGIQKKPAARSSTRRSDAALYRA